MTVSETPWKRAIRDILSRRPRRSISRRGFRSAAVLVPLYELGGECYVVLTKRSDTVVYHKGQVSFPGGAYEESDGDLATTALREASEEVGIHAEEVELLGALDDQATVSSRYVVTPFVGALGHPGEFVVNHGEVQELLEVPVSVLRDASSYSPQTEDECGVPQPWGHYRYKNNRITGVTALILKQLMDIGFS
jgi:8-oxo-dGTP pyrophosphatase MutT (NUDIX family)